jgi:hypothetical protein
MEAPVRFFDGRGIPPHCPTPYFYLCLQGAYQSLLALTFPTILTYLYFRFIPLSKYLNINFTF